MLLVRQNLKVRNSLIRNAYNLNVIRGVYLAQANFEWVIRRVLLIMDRKGEKSLYGKNLNKYKTLKQFLRIWDQQISKLSLKEKPESFLPLDKVISGWNQLQKISFNHLPHARSFTGKLFPAYTEERLEVLIQATEDVHEYALKIGIDVFTRLPRIKK